MNWIRLHITTEGQTEQRFVRTTLKRHLNQYHKMVNAIPVLTSRDNKNGVEYRGGFRKHNAYPTVRKDIINSIKINDKPDCRFSTMFDLYALPNDFPGWIESSKKDDPYEKVKIIEDAFFKDISDPRFIPYIQLHEFEALIFSDPHKMAVQFLDHKDQIDKLSAICDEVNDKNPERINDGKETAPSKRILSIFPNYKKTSDGPAVVESIGMKTLKEKCQHFREWVENLEKLDIITTNT